LEQSRDALSEAFTAEPDEVSGRTGLEQSRDALSEAFTAEPDEVSGRTERELSAAFTAEPDEVSGRTERELVFPPIALSVFVSKIYRRVFQSP